MALVVPQVGEGKFLELMLGKDLVEDIYLKLFTNDLTPDDDTVIGDITEASGNGYAVKTLTMANWTVTPAATTVAVYAQQTFSFTGDLGNCYGYFWVMKTTGTLLLVERFPDAPYYASATQDILITPRIEAA